MGCRTSKACVAGADDGTEPTPHPGKSANDDSPKHKKKHAAAAADITDPSLFRPIQEFNSHFTMGKVLGSGHFASVHECWKTDQENGGTHYAVKIIAKRDLVKSLSAVKTEIAVLQAIGKHKFVVSLHEAYEAKDDFYLLMDLCSGGDLFSRIVADGAYTERQAARACKQLAIALQHVHGCGVAHRDLKPENVLLATTKPDSSIKVADFGLSKLLRASQTQMRTVCGTWAYCAPEIIERKPYDHSIDVWTLGILLYIIVAGYHPFDPFGDTPEPELLRKICNVTYDFEDALWNDVSKEAKDLIRRILVKDASKRISLQELLDSAWIQQAPSTPLSATLANLEKYNRKRFKGVVMATLASKKFRNSVSGRRNSASGKGRS